MQGWASLIHPLEIKELKNLSHDPMTVQRGTPIA